MSAEVPIIIPQPKSAEARGVAIDLSGPVRLEASGEISGGQTILCSILESLGVMVDDKGPYTVKVHQDPDTPAPGVSKSGRDEYYELTLNGSGAEIKCTTGLGARWGLQTFASLVRSASNGTAVPELTIKDWPDLANRGIFVENKWGPDRMTLDDWKDVIDRLAALKMNRMGVGIYGCWGNCHYENWPTEFMMVPVPGHPELKTEKNLRWYSPRDGQWRRETHLPFLFEGDFLADVVQYGKEKGVTAIPLVNSLGHNTMIPREFPAVSAKDADGTPRNIGYCLSAPETRAFIEGFYGSIVDRYFPDGCDFFHIQLDEVWPDCADPHDPPKRVDPWCECPECARQEREENLQAYIVWLVKMLTEKGVKKVVMWNDQLTRHMSALDDSFVGKLRAEGLEDRLILHWWWYSNDALNDQTRVSIGKKLGLPGWVAPMTCYYNWERYRTTFQNIELMLDMCHDEGGEGTVSYAVHDPAWTDHEMLMASYAWNREAVSGRDDQRRVWAESRFGSEAGRFLDSLASLQNAALGSPALDHCWFYPYSYSRPNVDWPRRYPAVALEKLASLEDVDVPGQLKDAVTAANLAHSGFSELLKAPGLTDDDRANVESLSGEAARVSGLAGVFGYLYRAWQAAAAGTIDPTLSDELTAARDALVTSLAGIESGKPDYVAPACLMALSIPLAFLDQLESDLAEVQAGTRKPSDIRWHVDFWAEEQ